MVQRSAAVLTAVIGQEMLRPGDRRRGRAEHPFFRFAGLRQVDAGAEASRNLAAAFARRQPPTSRDATIRNADASAGERTELVLMATVRDVSTNCIGVGSASVRVE